MSGRASGKNREEWEVMEDVENRARTKNRGRENIKKLKFESFCILLLNFLGIKVEEKKESVIRSIKKKKRKI